MMNCRAMMHLENYLLEHIVKQYKNMPTIPYTT